MEKPLLSIAVPTKDRYPYLKKLVELIEGFNTDEIELVIQDNSVDNSDFLSFLEDHKLNVIYNHTQGQIPMATNSDYAILNSSGEYICFIGDDDGVTRHILDCVKWMMKEGVDAVLPVDVSYNWPDVKSAKGFDNSSKLYFKPLTGQMNKLDPQAELLNVLKTGFKDRGKLPMVYHGIVSRKCLDKVYEIGKTFFPANSPDISNAVSLSFVVKKFYEVSYPLTISGASKYHGGGAGLVKKRFPELTDILWFLPNAIAEWEPTIPKMGVGDCIWPESGIKALRYNNREDLIDKVNFDAIYARFVAYTYPLRHLAYEIATHKRKVFWASWILIAKRYINAVVRLLMQKFGKAPQWTVINDVEDINQAAEELEKLKILSPFELTKYAS